MEKKFRFKFYLIKVKFHECLISISEYIWEDGKYKTMLAIWEKFLRYAPASYYFIISHTTTFSLSLSVVFHLRYSPFSSSSVSLLDQFKKIASLIKQYYYYFQFLKEKILILKFITHFRVSTNFQFFKKKKEARRKGIFAISDLIYFSSLPPSLPP